MRLTAAILSALFIATGLAAPVQEAKDAAAAELDARLPAGPGCSECSAVFPPKTL